MKIYRLVAPIALLAVAACGLRPQPTANPKTALPATSTPSMASTAPSPTALAATLPPSPTPWAGYPAPTSQALGGYPAPGPTAVPPTATSASPSTLVPSPTLPASQPTVTAVPFTPLPPATVIGRHVVQPGETMFCIARGYGVLPAAIAQANGLGQTFLIYPGQVLNIPAIRWTDIKPGPACATQFASPYPGLPGLASTPVASPTQSALPLTVRLDWSCIANCGNKDGSYVLRVDVLASGGILPYAYAPAQSYDITIPHCITGQGTAAVTSADGQTQQATWTYLDVVCP